MVRGYLDGHLLVLISEVRRTKRGIRTGSKRMTDEIQTISEAALTLRADALAARAVELAQASISPNTRRAYESGAKHFTAFCASLDVPSLPADPATVARYVAQLVDDGRASSTIDQRLAAIRWAHRVAGHESPTAHAIVERVTAGARRERPRAPKTKRALLAADVRRLGRREAVTMRDHRDRAVLLLGFAGGFRRSELAGLDVDDLRLDEGAGLAVMLRTSKTDQTGEGRRVAIPTGRRGSCPVEAVRTWLAVAGIEEGPVFRRLRKGGSVGVERMAPRTVASIVKRAAADTGADPEAFGGHSLRRGLVTSAVRAGRSDAEIMTTTGHRSREMLDRYREDAGRYDDAASVGLL